MTTEEDKKGNDIEGLLTEIISLLQAINQTQIGDMGIKDSFFQFIKDHIGKNKLSTEESGSAAGGETLIKENGMGSEGDKDIISEPETTPEEENLLTQDDMRNLLDKLTRIESKLNDAHTDEADMQALKATLSSLNDYLNGTQKREDDLLKSFSTDIQNQLSPLTKKLDFLNNLEGSLAGGWDKIQGALETFIEEKLRSLETSLPSLLAGSVPREIKDIEENLKDLKEEFEKQPYLKPTLEGLSTDASNVKKNVDDIRDTISALKASLEKLEGKLDDNPVDYERIEKAARDQGGKQLDCINSLKSDLSGEIRGLKTSNQTLEKGVKDYMQETFKAETKNQTSALENIFNTLLNALSPLGSLTSLVEDLKKNLDEDNKNLRGEKEQALLSSQKSQGEINKLNDTVADLKKKLEQRDSNITQQDKEISGLKSSLEQLRRDLENNGRELDSLRKEKESLENKNSAVTGANQVWQERLRLYEPVRDALLNSPFFAEFARVHDIGEDDEGLFNCMRHIGKSSDFLRQIHDYACKIKTDDKDNAKAMQPDEIAVYDALNKCYRNLMNVDFDYFVQSGDLPVTEPFAKTKFNKTNDKYMKDPIDRNRVYVKWIYVPLLKNDSNAMLKPAEVEAGND